MTPAAWVSWVAPPRPPPRPRDLGQGSPQQALDDLTTTRDTDLVYDSMDELAAAFHARLATLIDLPEFRAWKRSNPSFKPRLSGLLWTAQGPRRITVLLDTGATHCFICSRLAAALNLRPSGQSGPTSVTTAATGGTLGLAAPVQIFLSLGDGLRESFSVSPMDMDVGDDMILGWDWIASHDLRHLYADGRVSLRSGPALLQLDLLPASARPTTRALPVIAHGEFRRLLRKIAREVPVVYSSPTPSTLPGPLPVPRRSTGWSRPVEADHAALAAVEAAQLQAARARRRPGRPVEPRPVDHFVTGMEVLTDGTELHLASFC